MMTSSTNPNYSIIQSFAPNGEQDFVSNIAPSVDGRFVFATGATISKSDILTGERVCVQEFVHENNEYDPEAEDGNENKYMGINQIVVVGRSIGNDHFDDDEMVISRCVEDELFKVYRADNLTLAGNIPMFYSLCMAISPDNKLLASGYRLGTVLIVEFRSGREVKKICGERPAETVDFWGNNDVSCCGPGTKRTSVFCYLLSLRSLCELLILRRHTNKT